MAEIIPVLRRFNLLAESLVLITCHLFAELLRKNVYKIFRSEDEITDGGFRSAPVRRSGEQRGIQAHPCNVSQKCVIHVNWTGACVFFVLVERRRFHDRRLSLKPDT